jgi:putative membrane protein
MAAPSDTLNADDVKFVKHEGAVGKAKLKLAELGAQKATRADVKAFAEMIVADHTKANEEMANLASTKGVELSAVIDPAHASTFQKLESYSGTEFDKEFLSEMVSGHKTCEASFETASKDAKDIDVKAYANKMLPTIKAHHQKAVELSSK